MPYCSAEFETSPWTRAALVVLAAAALYLGAFFPAMSYLVRHSGGVELLSVWSWLPSPVITPLWATWKKIDSRGAEIVFGPENSHRS